MQDHWYMSEMTDCLCERSEGVYFRLKSIYLCIHLLDVHVCVCVYWEGGLLYHLGLGFKLRSSGFVADTFYQLSPLTGPEIL